MSVFPIFYMLTRSAKIYISCEYRCCNVRGNVAFNDNDIYDTSD